MDQLRTDLGKIRQEKMIEKVTTGNTWSIGIDTNTNGLIEKEKELQEKLYKFPKTSRAKLTDMKDTMIAFESIGAILHNVIFWKIMEGQDAYYMEEPLTGFTSLAEIMKKPTNERGFSIRTLAQELMEVILQLVELKRYHNEISTSSVFVSCKDKKLTVCLSEFFRYPEHNKELKEYTPAFMIFEDKKDNYNMVNQLSNVLAAMLESEEKQGGGISDETKKDMNEYNDFQNKIKDKTDIKALRLCEYISNIEGLREVNNFREEYSIVEKGEGCPNGILGEGGFGKIYLVESNKEKSVPGSGPRQRYALKGKVCETRPKDQTNSKSDGLQQ